MVDLQDDSINLRALRKIDDNIQEILFSAGQVAIYYFNLDDTQWKRKEIEGALFLVKRGLQPEYSFVVINKLSTINLVQRITKDFETNVQLPYLMYKNTENEIYCVWFYVKDNCVALNEKISDIIDKMKKNQLFSHSINQLNGLSSNNANSTNSDLLKMILSVENNNAHEAESQKPSQAAIPTELLKPIAQRRSVNLKDLFESHLNISNANTNEMSTPLKGDDIVIDPDTPYQFLREENVKNNFPLNISKSNNSTINLSEVKDSKSSQDNFIKQPQFPANSSLFDPKTPKANESESSMYLTMEQLKKTMIYLLQNDADFLHSIHTTYVNAIKK